MKTRILRRLPPRALRSLARRKGYPGRDDDPLDDVASWLLGHYAQELSRSARDQTSFVLDRARSSLEKIRARIPVMDPGDDPDSRKPAQEDSPEQTREPEGPHPDSAGPDEPPDEPPTDAPIAHPEDEDSIPRDPAMRTLTLAGVYENQGMFDEALAILQGILEQDPSNKRAVEGVIRITARLSGQPEQASRRRSDGATVGPGVGVETWDPSAEPVAEADALPLELPDLADLPLEYGVDEAILLMVRPDLLYACWEVTPETHRKALSSLVEASEAHVALRLVSIVISSSEPTTEVVLTREVDALVGEHFIHDVAPDCMFHAEIGLLHHDGFVPLVRTNATSTPAGQPSSRVDEQWGHADQSPMDRRGIRAHPPRITHRSVLSPREMALLRLHTIGPEAYSSISGIDIEQLKNILETAPSRIQVQRLDLTSSGPGSSSRN